MAEYRLSNTAKEDLIRIYQYGVQRFGESQAEKYFNTFFKYFEIIAQRPNAFESVDIKSAPGVFLSEIVWREFSYYLLYHFPHLPTQPIQDKFQKKF